MHAVVEGGGTQSRDDLHGIEEMIIDKLISLAGLPVFIAIAWAFCEERRLVA